MFSIITLGYFAVNIEKPFKEDINIIESLAQDANSHFADIFTKHLDTNSSALCKALCIADKSELSADIKKNFSRAGASHILAVSGMHVGIIFTAISTLIGLISKSRKFQLFGSIIAICFLWFYCVFHPISEVFLSCFLTELVCEHSSGKSTHADTAFVLYYI